MLIVCPSRGRPTNIAVLQHCWDDTTNAAELLVCVDEDDPTLNEYRALFPTSGRGLVVGPRKSLCGWINHVALALCDIHDAIGFIGDDVRPRTPNWDTELVDSLQPFGVVYGNDLHQGERLCTHPLFDSRFVQTWGFACPPGLTHLYVDNFWMSVGQRLGTLVYREDVILEHMHPHAGKADMDAGYREVNSRDSYRLDRAAYERYMTQRFDEDMERLCKTSSSPAS